LPIDLRALSTLNAMTLHPGRDFNHHIRRVIDAVESIQRRAL